MPLKEEEAFVLGSLPLGESDRIVTFLTRGAGKVRGVAKGARRSRRRFGSNLELLSRVRLSYFERERADLARIEAAELLESFYALQEDPERGAVMACLAEIADAFSREQQEDEGFFRLMHAVLRALRAGLDLDLAARYFEIWTLRLHGVLPSLRSCSACGAALRTRGARYQSRQAGVVCSRCAGARGGREVIIPAAAVRAAEEIQRLAPERLAGRDPAPLAPLGALAREVFLDLTERRFRSYDVLCAIRRRA
ncbi:MAG: DNA repair protein RecO [Acidobacteriota bacterium]